MLRRMSDWEYNYPEGIDILAVARMNRPNDTHFHKRRVLQLAEALLKQELRQYVVAREDWLQPWAMRRLQLSLSPNLAGHFFDAAQIQAPWEHALVPSGTRGRRAQPSAAATTRSGPATFDAYRRAQPKREADALRHWERAPRGRGRCVASTLKGAPTS